MKVAEKTLTRLDMELILESLGERRLVQKKQRMENLLKIAEPNEALYREIMLSLGYKKNKVQFQELALILPYAEILKLKNQDSIEKALLYRGGFIRERSGLPEDFDTSLRMKRNVWVYQGVRPSNFPERRIKGISAFLSETCRDGVFEFFKKRIREGFTLSITRRNASRIVNKIVPLKGMGKERGLEIFFNIVLPFFEVIFEKDGKPQLVKFLDELYANYPPLRDNSITKLVRRKLFKDKKEANAVISVKRYMGLIQYYHENIRGGKNGDT